MFKKSIAVLGLLLISACHPLVMFSPKSIKPSSSQAYTHKDDAARVRVTVDSMGLPYIKAQSIDDVMYGLGFMHARDRLFQLDLVRHAAQGRTAELFGERGLSFDKRLRVLTFRLDEQIENLSDEENHLLDHYVKGVNDGAKQRGRTAEHFLLGIEFEEFQKRDVVAIARLQAWQLGSDLYSEITRLKIARANLPENVKEEFLSSMDDRGSAILPGSLRIAEQLRLPSYLLQQTSHKLAPQPQGEDIVQTTGGASNAWAVHASLAKDGHALLMNDPHLQHNWPSNFYLATLEADNFFVTGATFVGLPGVLIGATKSLAWGVTASCLNTQDGVLLQMASGEPSTYVVDGKKLTFTEWPQKFCTNKKGACTDSMFYTSIFGPVIDAQFDATMDKNDRVAIQWTGFHIEQHKNPSGGFLTLARARDVIDGVNVVKTMTLPGVNLVLADVAGNIGYAYAGLVPKRDNLQHPYLPLDGGLSVSKWTKFLNHTDEPSAVNPSIGYLITANQNIFSNDAHPDLGFGKQGSPPYRALRIKERIDGMLKANKHIDFDEISNVQLDDTSFEAKELAPLVGSVCVDHFANADIDRQRFAKAVRDFDGQYSVDSLNALPYEMLMNEIIAQRLASAFGDTVPTSFAHVSQTRFAIKNALRKEFAGKKTPIFASLAPVGEAKQQIRAACEPGFQSLIKRASKKPSNWRWGRHHYLQRQSPLAKAPVVGGFFRDKRREVAGSATSPMAEGGLPVAYGANLRFRVKMTTPPEIYAIIDAGNSGTVGDKNAFDQAALWHEGKSLRIDTDWESAFKKSKKYFELDRAHVQAKK